MHIVIIAWLFITFTMALTMRSALAGIALFVALGVAPVALLVAVSVRRVRMRRARDAALASVRQRDVDARDDADPERDQ